MKLRCQFACFVIFAIPSLGIAASLDDYEAPEAGSVRIVRDTYSVPHIIARDEPSLFYGAGYCQAEDQLENLVMNMLRAQGRSAEREGLSALPLDHLVRVLDLPGRAARQFAQLESDERVPLDAFVAGVNAYVAKHRSEIPEWIEPLRPEHILAFSDYVDVLFSASHCRRDLEAAGIKLGMLDGLPALNAETLGSNQFAVAPSRSASGNAMLSMDPHLPHSSFYRWYEMHLVGPGINVMGACFYGSPFVSMGRTDRSAWCMTVNGPDLGDVFTFEVHPDDPTKLKGIGGWESFEITQEIHRVKTPGGTMEIKLNRQDSPVGPVMTTKDNVAYAFAVPLSDSPNRAGQILDMTRARNVAEFRQSLEPLGLVMFNILYADSDGDIFIISNARLPKRDLRIDSSALRPGDQEWARWQGFHSLNDLPQVLNPPCGYLMNTNSGAHNVTEDVAPRQEDFAPYFMSQQHNSRSRRLSALLSANSSIDWDAMQAYATDTHLLAADEYVPRIISVIEATADGLDGDAETLKEVARVLTQWDRRTDADSRGAVLFSMIVSDKAVQAAAEQGDDQAAAKAIIKQAAEVRERFGRLDCPWGDFSRIRRGDVELGIAGNGARDAVLNRIGMTALRPTYGEVKDGRRYCNGGSSYAMIVDFSGPTRAMSCLPFGVSEDPQSPHFADQLPLYADAKYKPAWFWPDEVRTNATSDIVLTFER